MRSRQLREADEQVGRSSRALRETETALAREQARAGAAAAAPRRAAGAPGRAARGAGAPAARGLRAGRRRAAEGAAGAGPRRRGAARCSPTTATCSATASQRIARADAPSCANSTRSSARSPRASDAARATRAQQREQLAKLEQDRRARAALVAQLDAALPGPRQPRAGARPRRARPAAAAQATARRGGTRRGASEAPRGRSAARDASAIAGEPRRQRDRARRPWHRRRRCRSAAWAGRCRAALLAGYGGTHARRPQQPGPADRAPRAGAPVKAVADGRVVYADWMNGYGLLLIVDHGNGYMSLYAHNDALLQGCRRRGEARRCGRHASAVPAARAARRCTSSCAATASRSIPRPGCAARRAERAGAAS